MKKILSLLFVSTFLLLTSSAYAIPTFYGPTPYLSTDDIPAGLYAGGSPTFLENFEDGSLDGDITASAGYVISNPNTNSLVDSVDADDGNIDGSGQKGHSWYLYPFPAVGLTFTFNAPTPVTAAGIVWTDGLGTFTFEALISGQWVSTAPYSLGVAGQYGGQTAEDMFFGVKDSDGIDAIRFMGFSGVVGGIEVDHVQYGVASVPEPATMLLLGTGLLGLVGIGRKKFFKE